MTERKRGRDNEALSKEEMDNLLGALQNGDDELDFDSPKKVVAEFTGHIPDRQDIKSDAGKVRPTLVPNEIIWSIARVREYGLKKYGDKECWQKVSVERYRDAAYRHWLAYLDDPKSLDQESKLPHLWHLACNIAFLIELEPFILDPDN